MSREELIAAGRAIYGERWQTALARALQVSDRAVRFWVSGQRKIPGWLRVAMSGLRNGGE